MSHTEIRKYWEAVQSEGLLVDKTDPALLLGILDEIALLKEEVRLREESQIPMIPARAQEKMEKLQREVDRYREALERAIPYVVERADAGDQLAESDLAKIRAAVGGDPE